MKLKDLLVSKNDYSCHSKAFTGGMKDLLFRDYNMNEHSINPSVSVILPSYNVTSSLPKTILAVNQQTYKNIEIIVADDHSNEDLLQAIPHIELPVKYIKNSQNRDRSFVRNTGLTASEGEIILILDPDMVPRPQHISNLISRITKIDGAVLVGMKDHIPPDDPRISYKNIVSGNIAPDYKNDWRYFRIFNPAITPPNFMQKQESKEREIRLLEE